MDLKGFSNVRLFVLGVLNDQARHGYDVVSVGERWAIHRWAGISIGATYNAIKRLAAEGLIVAGEQFKSGNRPERQIWSVTDAGRAALLSYVRHGLSSLDFEGREVDVALAFAKLLPPTERRDCLEQRIPAMEERTQQLLWLDQTYSRALMADDPTIEMFKTLKIEHPWIHAGIRHGLARINAERQWLNELIQEVVTWPSATTTSDLEAKA